MEACGTPYFDVPASEKTLSIQIKKFLFEIYDSNHLITDVRKTKYFIFSSRTLWYKVSHVF